MMISRYLRFCLFLFCCFANKGNSLKIVVSFSILRDLVEQVTQGVDGIEIICTTPQASDPHCYQPTPKDIEHIVNADIIIINGIDFEKNIEKIIKTCAFKGVLCVASNNIKQRVDLKDPHVWHDVNNIKFYIGNILDYLIKIDYKNKAIYEKNIKNLLCDLKKLNNWVIGQFKGISADKRIIVTTHDAFWYFGKAYGVEILSPLGTDTEIDASAQKVAELIDIIKEKGIKAVFIENLADRRTIKQIATETGLKMRGVLYADSLPDNTKYQDMVRINVQTIIKAIQ